MQSETMFAIQVYGNHFFGRRGRLRAERAIGITAQAVWRGLISRIPTSRRWCANCLRNVDLQPLGFLDVGEGFVTFDYILVHGG